MNTTVKRILGVCFLIAILLIAVNYSIVDALALSLCAGGFVWILFDRRIADLKTRLAIMENGENRIHESVEALYRGETIFQESVAETGAEPWIVCTSRSMHCMKRWTSSTGEWIIRASGASPYKT